MQYTKIQLQEARQRARAEFNVPRNSVFHCKANAMGDDLVIEIDSECSQGEE